MKKLLALVALSATLVGGAFAEDPKPMPPGPAEPLTIVSGDKTHTFQVELADTPMKSELGLMYRKEMAKDHGMIFDFGQPTNTGMWMKNTLIPLDMLFMDSSGSVVAIAENARPGSLRIITPGFAVKSVLELNGGVAKELGLKPGDKVQHKIFQAAAKPVAPAKPAKPAQNGG